MPEKKTAKKTKDAAGKKTPQAPAAKKKTAARKTPAHSREDSLRNLLLIKREEILRETQNEIAKYIKGENRQLVESALDDGDWSVIDLAEDINLRKLGTNRETLIKIDEALRKLKENSYGICEDCEDEINAERLRVMPFAIRCRDCQEAQEEKEAFEKESSPGYRR
jgi:DnaK suppressor protein